jgi:hypothetical protein
MFERDTCLARHLPGGVWNARAVEPSPSLSGSGPGRSRRRDTHDGARAL